MKKILLLIGSLTVLTACSNASFFNDYEKSLPQPMTFEVREVGLDDIVDKNPSMQVRRDLAKEENETLEIDPEQNEEKAYRVNTDVLNLRSDPSQEGEIIDELAMGTEVEILETLDGEDGAKWVKVLANGSEGYLVADYLTDEEVEAPIGIYRSVIYQLNIRSEPTEDSEVVGELGYFEEFDVYEKVKDENGVYWLETKLGDGTKAYVSSELCVEVD